MKKKLIIFLLGVKVRKFDYERFDADVIKKSNKMEFEFHELVDFINPGFSKVFTADRLTDHKTKIFSNFENWKKEIIDKKKNYKNNLFVYNTIRVSNFESFKINYFLFKNKFTTIEPSNLDHPTYAPDNTIYKIKWLIRNIFFNQKKILFFLKNRFFSLLKKFLEIKPNFYLKCGSIPNEYEKKKGVKILNGHSRDYNMYIKTKNINFYSKDTKKYGLFLESVTPIHNIGDAYIQGDESNYRGSAKKWLNSLNHFFNQIEQALKIKIFIVPHPKIEHLEKFSRLYNGREILREKLAVVSKKTELIIARDSTGFSFAAIHKKPSIFVFNNELLNLNNNFIKNQKKFAKALGQNPVNMDKNFSKNEITDLLKFNKSSYENYIKLYHSSRDDHKTNIEILEENLFQKIL